MDRDQELALLRRFEPIIRYTRGEQFFPMDVELYVRACSLWVQKPGEEAVCLVPVGELTLEILSQPYHDEFGTVRFLKITDPLGVRELAAYALRPVDEKDAFRAGWGRLARVGYLSRLIDAIFSISLLTRGRVPGDRAAAADLIYDQIQLEQEHYSYSGRVVRQNDWIVLQYWFFYLYNNWRSRFSGTNDHEADWEMICIYLSEMETENVQPEWVAYASHDYAGDDLRRRWDDPELEKLGEHPIVYAGAGSHASYYCPGEYLTELELPFLRPFAKLAETVRKFWHEQLRQYRGQEDELLDKPDSSSIFTIPFVDYARGDGLAIGPDQAKSWGAPKLLNPEPDWAKNYRGLWGLYTHDPFAGEDAPAGPRYNRDGSIRHVWYDPVGWAGLDKVPPPQTVLETIQNQKAEITARGDDLEIEISAKSRYLKGLGIEAAAMRQQPHMEQMYETHKQQIEDLSETLKQLRANLAADQSLLDSLERYEEQIKVGWQEPARNHLQRAHHPMSQHELRGSRFAEVWAAISVGLMLIGFVSLARFGDQHLILWVVAILALFIFAEATFRGRVTSLITSLTIWLAVIATLVILYEFFWEAAGLAILIAGVYILWENLRELGRLSR